VIKSRLWNLCFYFVMLFILFGCDQSNESPSGPTYKNTSIANEQTFHLAIHPLHNPKKLSEAYQPLIDYLNKEIPDITFKLSLLAE